MIEVVIYIFIILLGIATLFLIPTLINEIKDYFKEFKK